MSHEYSHETPQGFAPDAYPGVAFAEHAAQAMEENAALKRERDQWYTERAYARGWKAGSTAAGLIVGQALGEKGVDAEYDELTGLRSRRMLIGDIENRMAMGDEFMVTFIDLDDFKSINDLYGHEVGNAYLRLLGNQFMQNLKRGNDAIRYGGDEIVILTSKSGNDRRDPEHWTEKEQRFIQANVQAFTEEMVAAHPALDLRSRIGMSMGSYIWTPEFTGTAENLLDLADMAMYKNKKAHKQHRAAHRRGE